MNNKKPRRSALSLPKTFEKRRPVGRRFFACYSSSSCAAMFMPSTSRRRPGGGGQRVQRHALAAGLARPHRPEARPLRARAMQSCPRPAGRYWGPKAAGQRPGGAGLASHRGWLARGPATGKRLCGQRPAPGSSAGCSPRAPVPSPSPASPPAGRGGRRSAPPHQNAFVTTAARSRNPSKYACPQATAETKKCANLPAGAF